MFLSETTMRTVLIDYTSLIIYKYNFFLSTYTCLISLFLTIINDFCTNELTTHITDGAVVCDANTKHTTKCQT